MLKKKKTINISGSSIINDTEAMVYTASIDSDRPENMTINYYQTNTNVYKANREACRADQAEFEEYAYKLQDELLGGK